MSPLDCNEFQPVHPKADQSWVFIGRTDVEAETPILGPPDVKDVAAVGQEFGHCLLDDSILGCLLRLQ